MRAFFFFFFGYYSVLLFKKKKNWGVGGGGGSAKQLRDVQLYDFQQVSVMKCEVCGWVGGGRGLLNKG